MSNISEKNLVLTRAQSAVISRDFITAARLYKQLLKTDPSNVDYLKELGLIYVKSNEDAKAIPYYEQIITFYPHYIEAMNSLGAIYRRLHRYEDSINILQRALEEERQVGVVHYNLGFTYKEMGNYVDAIESFEIAINENPSDVLAYNHLGKIYTEQKEYQKAITSYKRGLGVDHNHPILNYNLAVCYDEAKMYPDAIRCYEAALKAKPGWLEAIKDFSSLLIRCQKTKEASDLVHRSIELHPNDSRLLCLLGRIYLDEYDYSSAERTFRRAEIVDGNDIAILSGLAEALEKSDKPDNALEPVLKALDLAPDNMDIKKQYIHTLLSAEEYDAALINVQELELENGSKDPEILDLYEQYYICTNNPEKAKEYSDKIVKVNKHYKNHLLSAAKRYNQIGNNEMAQQKAKEFIAREIRNPEGYNTLGKIYTASGNIQEAIDSYDKSRALKKPNILADKQITKLQGLLGQIPPPPPEDIPFYDEVEEEVEETEEIVEVPEETEIEIEPVEEDTEDFDFTQLGGNVPLEEALLEDEKPFFDKLDELTGKPEPLDQSEEEVNTVENQNGILTPVAGMNGFSDGSMMGGAMMNGVNPGGAMMNGAAPAENGFAPSSSSDNGSGSEDPEDAFDFGQFDNISAEESDDYMQQPPMQVPPKQESAGNYGAAQSQPQDMMEAPSREQQYNDEMQRRIQDAVMNSSNYAMETALSTQKLANQLAAEQEVMKDRITSVENQQAALQQGIIPENAVLTEETVMSAEEVSPVANVTPEETVVPAEEIAVPVEEPVSSPTETAETLLPAIERILADENIALENEDKIGLFKKLLSLSDFLPDSEKTDFLSGRTRMQLEYLIAKMSGKPGLLKTSQSLIKSGYLGEELTGIVEKDEYISNESVKNVLRIMKKLSNHLEDQSLAQALCNSADGVLEKIELEDKKSQIF